MMEIYPHDVLMFRESRDFSAGEGHVAVSQEPLPHTIAGAIMSIVYNSLPEEGATKFLNLEERRDLLNRGVVYDWSPGFSILGTFLALKGNLVFPLPKDLVGVRDERGHSHLVQSKLRDVKGLKMNVVVAPIPTGGETLHFSPAGGFLLEREFREYLKGEKEGFEGLATSDVYVMEERIGIGLTEGKVTEEGLLYRTLNLRLKDEVTIRVYFDGNEEGLFEITGEKGIMKLGGESRLASFKHVKGGFPFGERIRIEAGQGVKLYFATPVIPREDGINGVMSDIGLEGDVLRVFTDKKVRVTGWDLMAKRPKETLYAYPAGTVVWLRASTDTEINIASKAGLMSPLGYGLILVGVV